LKLKPREAVKRMVPQVCIEAARGVRRALARLPQATERHFTRRIFQAAGETPPFLESDVLEELQNAFPRQTSYRYDPGAVEARGRRRAAEVVGLPQGRRAEAFLELGCWDGMISGGLAQQGKKVTAVDRTAAGFDRRARDEGVRFVQADAGDMPFRDEEFDPSLTVARTSPAPVDC
jgi:SAM-dependent methyltransferase